LKQSLAMIPCVQPDDGLSNALGALASPTRLAIMRALRAPKPLHDIEVRAAEGEEPARPLARQTIRKHLDVLIEAGVVNERVAAERSEFVVNHQAIFVLSEQLRNLARLRPSVEPQGVTRQVRDVGPLPKGGPALVLVKGLDEGEWFDLKPSVVSHWILGRRRGCAVALDFDPSVSSENARISWAEGAHWLEDLPGSRNGTTHNMRRLDPSERARLRHGDIVGVGRSLLVYWS
jgi:DNA-binding transcriptional ArsR family regulator